MVPAVPAPRVAPVADVNPPAAKPLQSQVKSDEGYNGLRSFAVSLRVAVGVAAHGENLGKEVQAQGNSRSGVIFAIMGKFAVLIMIPGRVNFLAARVSGLLGKKLVFKDAAAVQSTSAGSAAPQPKAMPNAVTVACKLGAIVLCRFCCADDE